MSSSTTSPPFAHLSDLLRIEEQRYATARPLSRQLAESGATHLLGSVPVSWMDRWATPFPLFLDRAQAARLIDVDGHEYVDLCLGDTAALAGHAPADVVEAVSARFAAGATGLLATADAAWVAADLSRRFGARRWQFTLGPTDATRFAIRLCRAITGRPRSLLLAPAEPSATVATAEFNDLGGVTAQLAGGDVAAVLTEPALTDHGIVLPDPGFLAELAVLCDRHGSLLVLDESHTWSAGPGGCTARWNVASDIVTLGAAMGAGVAIGAVGLGRGVVAALGVHPELELEDARPSGGTLAGSALALAAARATLAGPLQDDAWSLAETHMRRLVMGLRAIIDGGALPWHVTQLGLRAAIGFTARPPRTGSEAAAGAQPLLARYLHLAMLNRGVLITPVDTTFLAGPSTTDHDVDRVLGAVGEAVQTLIDVG